jgi:hypothetical protein
MHMMTCQFLVLGQNTRGVTQCNLLHTNDKATTNRRNRGHGWWRGAVGTTGKASGGTRKGMVAGARGRAAVREEGTKGQREEEPRRCEEEQGRRWETGGKELQ